MDLNESELEILKLINSRFLDLKDLTILTQKCEDDAKLIVDRLFEEGLIDRLDSNLIFFIFPELRSKKYRSKGLGPRDFLATTRKGFFKLNPIIKR